MLKGVARSWSCVRSVRQYDHCQCGTVEGKAAGPRTRLRFLQVQEMRPVDYQDRGDAGFRARHEALRPYLPMRIPEVQPNEFALVGLVPSSSLEVFLAQNPGDCMKLILASPTYGPVDPDALRYQRAAIMHASRNGCEWLGDASPDRQPYAAARNNVVQSIIHDEGFSDDTKIVWLDSDIVLPVDAITSLAAAGKDIVTGIYFQRHFPHWPLIANYNAEKNSFNWIVKWPPNSIFPIDGCGFGIILTSIDVFRKMDPPWFEFKKFSEDFDFCLKAKAKGFQVFADSSVLCGHLQDPEPATIETYTKAHPELIGGEDGTIRSKVEARDLAVSEGTRQR
jgi:hypothetical protein